MMRHRPILELLSMSVTTKKRTFHVSKETWKKHHALVAFHTKDSEKGISYLQNQGYTNWAGIDRRISMLNLLLLEDGSNTFKP